jgi:hypothetical protein
VPHCSSNFHLFRVAARRELHIAIPIALLTYEALHKEPPATKQDTTTPSFMSGTTKHATLLNGLALGPTISICQQASATLLPVFCLAGPARCVGRMERGPGNLSPVDRSGYSLWDCTLLFKRPNKSRRPRTRRKSQPYLSAL